jgi:hypothetical protein
MIARQGQQNAKLAASDIAQHWQSSQVDAAHVAEAIRYRTLDRAPFARA